MSAYGQHRFATHESLIHDDFTDLSMFNNTPTLLAYEVGEMMNNYTTMDESIHMSGNLNSDAVLDTFLDFPNEVTGSSHGQTHHVLDCGPSSRDSDMAREQHLSSIHERLRRANERLQRHNSELNQDVEKLDKDLARARNGSRACRGVIQSSLSTLQRLVTSSDKLSNEDADTLAEICDHLDRAHSILSEGLR